MEFDWSIYIGLVNLQYWQLDPNEINLKDVIAEFVNLKARITDF
jgi:hypothetical protein